MSERRVFESLCMDPGEGGFSYDTALLVDVDRAVDFDEAVIRLTTKCSSIITQLSTLGNPVVEFSIACAKVDPAPANRLKTARSSGLKDDTCHHSLANTPERRNLRAMEELWSGLKRKNYSGMVAVARLTRASIPRNGCGTKYSVHALKEALLSHVQAYFMFQAYNSRFQPWRVASKTKEDEAHAEYLMFLVYRIQHSPVAPAMTEKRPRRLSEMEKLETYWSLGVARHKRKRQLSSGSSVSSSSSASSNSPSGTTPHLHILATPTSRAGPILSSLTDETKEHSDYGVVWNEWSITPRESVNRQSVVTTATGSQMILRHRKGATKPYPQR